MHAFKAQVSALATVGQILIPGSKVYSVARGVFHGVVPARTIGTPIAVMLWRWMTTAWERKINLVVVNSPMFKTPTSNTSFEWDRVHKNIHMSVYRAFWNGKY